MSTSQRTSPITIGREPVHAGELLEEAPELPESRPWSVWRLEYGLLAAAAAMITVSSFIFFFFDIDLAELTTYGYIGLFVISLISAASILLPMPGAAAVAGAGAFLDPILGIPAPILVGLVAGPAEALGELTGYAAGYGGSSLFRGRSFYPRVRAWMERRGIVTMFLLSSFPNPLLDIAGVAAGDVAGYWSMITASKRTALAGLVLGIAAGFHMFVMKGLQVKFGVQNFGELMQRMGLTFGLTVKGTVFDPGYWYVTTQEAQWVGWVTQKLGIENMDNIFFGLTNGIPNPLFNPADWMTIGLLGGACIMALAHNEFKWKKPTMELAFWAILGGFFMGIGSRLAMGCNVGAFFIRVSNGNPSGWLFGIGMVGGAFLGVKVFNWYTERKLAKEMEAF